MADYLNIEMTDEELRGVSSLGLAHVGDCVYELMVRSYIVCHGKGTSAGLHRATVGFVSAPAQSEAVKKILPVLSQEETAVFKRGRNARVNSVPKNAELAQYHAATGLETLFGWLYLKDRHARLNELFAAIMENE